MNVLEIVLEKRIRYHVSIDNMQFGFMPGKGTTYVLNCIHIRTTWSPLDLWNDPTGVMELLARWRDKLTGGPKWDDRTPSTNKGQGSG